MRRSVVLLAAGVLSLWGCAQSAPVPPTRPIARPFDDVRRVVIVASGDSRFTVLEQSAEPARSFDEILKRNPYGATLRPVFALLHQGINWLLEYDQKQAAAPHVRDVTAHAVVAEALARTLEASGRFDQVRAMQREPIGDDRRRTDAVVRLSIPAWGLMRVREGSPNLVSGFADVHAQLVVRGSGAILWEDTLDVTGPERLPMESFTRDWEFARQELLDVLDRAGQRVANELLYARGGGR